MGMAIIMSVILTIGTYIFILLLYLLFCIITTIINNVGKDKYQWYGYSILATNPRTVRFESFGELFKSGVIEDAKLSIVVFFIALGVCIYVTLT